MKETFGTLTISEKYKNNPIYMTVKNIKIVKKEEKEKKSLMFFVRKLTKLNHIFFFIK